VTEARLVVAPPVATSARPARPRRVSNLDILPDVLAGLMRAFADADRRAAVAKAFWIEAKRHGGSRVVNIDASRVCGIQSANVHGPVGLHCPLIVPALAMVLGPSEMFEFGTFRGESTWLLAHNVPSARVYTLDLPGPEAVSSAKLDLTDPEYFATWDRGIRFRGTPEAGRIVQLTGDTATFDFTSFAGRMDFIYIDASHSYSYVRSDTEAALEMLSPTGAILWDDYTLYPGIFTYVNELAPTLDRPIHHVLGTRLALYSRRDIVLPEV